MYVCMYIYIYIHTYAHIHILLHYLTLYYISRYLYNIFYKGVMKRANILSQRSPSEAGHVSFSCSFCYLVVSSFSCLLLLFYKVYSFALLVVLIILFRIRISILLFFFIVSFLYLILLSTHFLQGIHEACEQEVAGKDKGGPSKGGFLNNRFFS